MNIIVKWLLFCLVLVSVCMICCCSSRWLGRWVSGLCSVVWVSFCWVLVNEVFSIELCSCSSCVFICWFSYEIISIIVRIVIVSMIISIVSYLFCRLLFIVVL